MNPSLRLLMMLVVSLAALAPALPARAQDPGPYVEGPTLGRGMVRSVAWSPDGGAIAVGGALGIWLYSPDLGDLGRLRGHTKAVYDLAWSPDGARLASASHDLTVRVWDRATQTELLTLEGHTGLVVAVAWSADGRQIVSGGHDGTIRLWDAATGAPLTSVEAEQSWITDLDFSPDGGALVSAGQDGSARLWDAATLEPRARLEGGDVPLVASRFSPDGAQILTASRDGTLRVWDAASGARLREVALASGALADAAWSPLGGLLAATWRLGGGMGALDLFPAALDSAEPLGHMAGNFGDRLSWSPQGDQVAVIGWDTMLSVWSALVCAPKLYRFEHTDWIQAVGWSVDGRTVTGVSGDGLARVWDAASGALLEASPYAAVEPAREAISPDGTRRALAGDAGVTITATGSGSVIARLPGAANAVAWSADGARLAVALRNGTIKVWEES